MRRYETIFILRPDLGESALKDSIKRFEGIVGNNGGDLVETEEWGSRELAYRIKGERRGFYVRLDYGGTGSTMNEVERNLKLSDGVLRYLSVLVDEAADMATVRSDIEARQKRAAEAKAATEARMAAFAADRAAAAEAAAEAQAAKERSATEAAATAAEAAAPSAPEAAPESVTANDDPAAPDSDSQD
ncbi:MAG: small subunit ribosomal protein [Candidatus Binataceae bacterium]|nr:small subunit ribosomal protein [Candidatus Binataceae bacterium]